MRKATLHGIIRDHVAEGSNIYTGEHAGYRGLDGYNHHTTSHLAGVYVIDDQYHTNSIESVWALLKRQIIGVHHWVSRSTWIAMTVK